MVVDALFDSVCRCFGAQTGPSVSRTPHNHKNSIKIKSNPEISSKNSDLKKRADRIRLNDKQYDSLFHKNNPSQAVADAKMSANRQQPAKRKSPASRRDDIFRNRQHSDNTKRGPGEKASSFRTFLDQQGVSTALCFASPINEDEIVKSDSDTNTLNTCEDTITSTLYFERKYSHVVEKRPPMPLFNQFKVDTHETDELRRIVANDSHNSMRMIRLLEDTPMVLSAEHQHMKTRHSDKEVQLPPVVAIDSSCSTNSSGSKHQIGC